MLTSIFLFSCTNAEATSLIELHESFGSSEIPIIVPYYHTVGYKRSYTTINAAIDKPDHGPRTFVTPTVHQIFTRHLILCQNRISIWCMEKAVGGTHSTTSLLPHVHKNGLYLDIFFPSGIKMTNQPISQYGRECIRLCGFPRRATEKHHTYSIT